MSYPIRIRETVRLTVAGIALSVTACGGSPGDPESELRAWVSEAEEAAENKDRGALLDKIATNYADARGHDRDELNDMFRFYMLRQQSIALLTKIDEIELLDGTAADMSLTVAMAGTGAGSFGLNADAYRIELELEKDGDDWLLIGARWGEVGGNIR